MATNLPPDWYKYYNDYLNTKTHEDKVRTLEIVLSHTPHHKATETLRAQLKQRLSKLKHQKEAKSSRKSLMIPKEGDAQVCILGLTQSGKSILLSKLTNAKPEISNHPYTTTKPEIGTCDYNGVKIQLIEIPSNFKSVFISIVQSSDAMILLYKNEEDIKDLKEVLSKFRIKKPFVEIKREEKLEDVKEKIWEILDLIRIYCKEPGKKPEKKPLVLKKGSTVLDAAERLHKDFIKYFKFARVFGSTKYPGEKVGLDYELKDKDVLEVHMG